MASSCAVCHDGSDDEWPLTMRSHLADWQVEIRGSMLDCSMPPRDSEIPITITTEERETLLEWFRCGLLD